MRGTDWRINAFSVFLCWMVIERFRSGAFTEPDIGYKLSLETTNMATGAADCHSKVLGGEKKRAFVSLWCHLSTLLTLTLSSITGSFVSRRSHLRVSQTSISSHLNSSANHFIALLRLYSPFASPLFLSLWGDD